MLKWKHNHKVFWKFSGSVKGVGDYDMDGNKEAIQNILDLAADFIGTESFFIGKLDEHFSVLQVFHKEENRKLTKGLVLPLDQSI